MCGGCRSWFQLTRLWKQRIQVRGCLLPDLFFGYAAQLCNCFRGMHHKTGLIALAAMRYRCKIGRVSLDEHAVKRDLLRGFTDVFCLGKADVPRSEEHTSE